MTLKRLSRSESLRTKPRPMTCSFFLVSSVNGMPQYRQKSFGRGFAPPSGMILRSVAIIECRLRAEIRQQKSGGIQLLRRPGADVALLFCANNGGRDKS